LVDISLADEQCHKGGLVV